jgi:hypothetical protein
MNCVILQPSYIPWRGYFHQIACADVFIFYDDVQYDKHGWRNRNRIKTPNGPQWLTIPVQSAGVVENKTPIREVRIDWKREWNRKHWTSIIQSYGRAPFFKQYADGLAGYYHQPYEYLADLTIDLTIHLAGLLGISNTRFVRASTLEGIEGTRTDRLIQIIKKVGADRYTSGPSARDYLDEPLLQNNGIILEYMQYNYPEYPQLYPPFDNQISILDLLFMIGPEALKYIL